MSATGCSSRSNSSELTPQARATLDKQAQWLNQYGRYAFTIEGHADERGTREYNIALGARRAQTVREYLRLARRGGAAHAHDFLRQGATGRGVQRHFLLVAEPPRRDRAQPELVIGRKRENSYRLKSRRRPRGAGSALCPAFRLAKATLKSDRGAAVASSLRCFAARKADEGPFMSKTGSARAMLALVAALVLSACGARTIVTPLRRRRRLPSLLPSGAGSPRYFEATGNTAAINTVDLVARVQGFVQAIGYTDGDFVKKGTSLFTIEPEPYKLKVEAAKASVISASATLKQAEAEFQRQADLVTKQIATQSNYDKALAQRDSAQADLQSARANEQQAEINLGYTNVVAPFDGVVSARQVSIGQLVGANSATVLSTIVQLDPIYVNFTGSERDVLQVRADLARSGRTVADLIGLPVEIGLQIENGFPHTGKFDYVAPTIDPSTGTIAARATLQNCRSRPAAGRFRARAHSLAAAAGVARARRSAR